MEYMNLIPDEVETLIFKDLNYMDLKHYAQTSRARTNLVYRHLAPIAGRARERFGLGPELSDQDIIERLYHVNGYTGSSFDNVTVGSLGWRGPGGSISRDALSWYNSSGELHREDGPAKISGNNESWYKNGFCHRNDGPAKLLYVGTLTIKEWYRDGRRHRIGGPAVIYYDHGNIALEKWFENGMLHRIDGPAIIDYYPDGNVRFERYFVNGR